jgi:5,10-methylenetetrahydromethanopterin reductase
MMPNFTIVFARLAPYLRIVYQEPDGWASDLVKFGFMLDPYDIHETVRMAQTAEKHGFDSCFLADESPAQPYRDPYIAMTVLLSKTKRIKTGTCVTPVYTRDPAMIALSFRSIEELAPGRTVVGLGPGGSLTLRPLGLPMWDRPITAVRESVQILRDLFDGKTVDVTGKKIRVHGVSLYQKPKRKIPIYIAARGPQMLRLAGEVADGSMMTSPTPYLKTCIRLIREGARKAGRDFDQIDIGNGWPFAVTRDGRRAREMVKPWCSFMFSDFPREAVRSIGFTEKDHERMRETFHTRGLKAAAELVTDKLVDAMTVAGTPDECAEKIIASVSAGTNHVLFGFPLGPDPVQAIKTMGTEILPRVKKAVS